MCHQCAVLKFIYFCWRFWDDRNSLICLLFLNYHLGFLFILIDTVMDSDGLNVNYGREIGRPSLDAQDMKQKAEFFSPHLKGTENHPMSNPKPFKFMRIKKPGATLLTRPFLFPQKPQLTPKKIFSQQAVPSRSSPFTGVLDTLPTFPEFNALETQHTPSKEHSCFSARRESPSSRSQSPASIRADGVYSINDSTNTIIPTKGHAREGVPTTVERFFMDIEQNVCTSRQKRIYLVSKSCMVNWFSFRLESALRETSVRSCVPYYIQPHYKTIPHSM